MTRLISVLPEHRRNDRALCLVTISPVLTSVYAHKVWCLDHFYGQAGETKLPVVTNLQHVHFPYGKRVIRGLYWVLARHCFAYLLGNIAGAEVERLKVPGRATYSRSHIATRHVPWPRELGSQLSRNATEMLCVWLSWDFGGH